MAGSYMLSDRVVGYEVKVCENRKIIVRKTFTDYDEAMMYLDHMESVYDYRYTVEFDTKFRR